MEHTRSSRFAGLILGVGAVALALTPSLVPRPAVFQGFLAGLVYAVAYLTTTWLWRIGTRHGAGRRVVSSIRRLNSYGTDTRAAALKSLPRPLPRWIWPVAGAVFVVYSIILATLVLGWQNDVRGLVEMPPADGLDVGSFFIVALIMGCMVFAGHQGLRKMTVLGRKWTQQICGTRAWAVSARSESLAVMAGGLVAGVLATVLLLLLLVVGALLATDSVYSARNGTTPVGIMEPASEYRSAGQDSAIDWDKLGMQGRAFVGGGPSAKQITEVTQLPALQPVRVYVGSAQTASIEERARLAVAELKRTGGFRRGTLMVATPTGSGWLERQAVDSLEYLHSGDTAIVSMQYSYQPSWVSFLFHQDLPRQSARALYTAVKDERDSMPEADRPALLVYGLSLGSSGMQAAFSDIDDLTSAVDGAVFSGSPNNSMPWGTLQAQRDSGSPMWQPVYDQGKHVRWLSNSGDFDKLAGAWIPGRVAYLQHGTDAVTWLTPRLIWEKPEWLMGTAASGGRAPDVSDSMHWIPLITWSQVVLDMFMGESVPPSHGHNFGNVAVGAWNGVHPSDLDPASVNRIQQVIASYPFEESVTQ